MLWLLESNHCNTYHLDSISSTILRSFVTQRLWGYLKLLRIPPFVSITDNHNRLYGSPDTSNCNIHHYATPKVTKYQRCNFIIQIHKFTIKIDTISINLLFECVKIVESVISIPTCFLSCIKRYFL